MDVDIRLQVSHLAVCTDASERGGGLCYSTGLTWCGGVQACALACDHEWVDSRRLGILDLNAGVGSLRRALGLLKVQPRAHVVTERNRHARAVLSARWPDATLLDSPAKLFGDQVKELLDAAPGVTDWIVVCAISRHRAAASASQLLETAAALRSLSHHVKVHVLAHGSISKRHDINKVSGMLGLSPVLLCPQRVLPCRHPRRLWASWPLKADSSMSTWRGARGKVRRLAFVRGQRLPTSAWATPGWAFHGPLLPPFIARPSRKRCRDKSWEEQPYEPAKKRRWSDGCHLPTPHYRPEVGLTRGDHCRPPCIEEKEKLLGFSQGHTEPSTSIRYAKQKPQEVCRIRHALLARSAHCQVLAWAVQAGLRYPRLPVRGCRSGAERTMADDVPAGHAPVIEGRELILQLRRRQHHKGREIRHASPMGTPRASQLGNLNPAWWKWKTAVSTTWQYPEHINILEMRMFSVGVRWRLSSPSAFNSTGLHAADSNVSLGAMSRGRSGSLPINNIMRRLSAHTLAAHYVPLLGRFSTSQNPADAPSRVRKRQQQENQ